MTRYYCFYISSSKFKEILENNELPSISDFPHIFIEPIEYYDVESLRALIGCKQEGKDWVYHTPNGIKTYLYFSEYEQGNAGVLTFDGISFYKILGYHFTEKDQVEINLLHIRELYRYKPNTAFMLMPFKDETLANFYEKNIRNFLKSEKNIEVKRANDFCDNDVIIDTIYTQVEQSEFIIAEITACNKNVFYELGYAAAKQKKIITLLQSGHEAYFFDRSHIRWIEYNLNNIESFKTQLIETIKSIRKKRGNPL